MSPPRGPPSRRRLVFNVLCFPTLSKEQVMKLFYINNDGGGFADTVEAPAGQSVQQFFKERMPDRRPQDYLIRVNRLPVGADQALQEHDRISISPTKIHGACPAV
jgi:hypothetical protein